MRVLYSCIMAKNQVDLIDIVALIGLPVFAGFVLGVWSLEITVFGGFDFAQTLWAVGGAEISPALILTVLCVGWIVATNEIDGSDYDQYEKGGIGFALGVVPVYAFVPLVQTLVDSSDIVRLVVWLAVAAVATYISYTE